MVEITGGDLNVPYIKGDIPGILVVELVWGATMSIRSQPMQLGGSGGFGKSGYQGTILLTGGEMWVYFLGQGPTITPLTGGESEPFTVLGEMSFDGASGDMHLVAPIHVEFEIDISGVPMFFNIEGQVTADYDCPAGEVYCTTAANSAGPGALITGLGGASVGANSLTLATPGCPPGGFGLYFYGTQQTQNLVGDGWLCVTGATYRMDAVPIDAGGNAVYTVDVLTPPDPAGQVSIGETWYYQFWYRDPAFGGSGFNFSDGLAVEWRL